MADINKLNPQFMDFIFGGLDHGIDSIIDVGGPLIPFVMTITEGKKELKRFVTEEYKAGIESAEEHLKLLSSKPDFALLAFNGYITWENKKYDAIIVRAFDKKEKEGYTFSQRYVPKVSGQGIEPIGNSAFIGNEPSILL